MKVAYYILFLIILAAFLLSQSCKDANTLDPNILATEHAKDSISKISTTIFIEKKQDSVPIPDGKVYPSVNPPQLIETYLYWAKQQGQQPVLKSTDFYWRLQDIEILFSNAVIDTSVHPNKLYFEVKLRNNNPELPDSDVYLHANALDFRIDSINVGDSSNIYMNNSYIPYNFQISYFDFDKRRYGIDSLIADSRNLNLRILTYHEIKTQKKSQNQNQVSIKLTAEVSAHHNDQFDPHMKIQATFILNY